MLHPNLADYCNISQDEKPKLVVVIDTEEEFDWSNGFDRDNTSVRAMRWIGRVQNIFDEYGITPVYVIDYPVASQPDGYQPLLDIYRSGRCIIGTHLHPWVNPPFEEIVSRRNTFAGNLPMDLERKKLQILGDCIEEKFGERPNIYKAGRYGVGPNTAEILEQEGYEVDLSICPHMDYSPEDGPNFILHTACPYWFGMSRRILELPLTVGFTGGLRKWGTKVYSFASQPLLVKCKSLGILARLNLLDKVWLSPEGYHSTEHIKLARTLYDAGLRIFSFAFHSPSVDPGYTPYVNSPSELDDFIDRCRRFFDYFFGELGGIVSTPLDIKAELAQPQPIH